MTVAFLNILMRIMNVYSKLIDAFNELDLSTSKFDLIKIERNTFSEEVKRYILENDLMPIVENYIAFKQLNTNAIRLSLPMLLNIKKNLKDTPTVKTVRYI